VDPKNGETSRDTRARCRRSQRRGAAQANPAVSLENPDYLCEQRKLPRSLSEYTNVHYLLVARDHWLWIDPEDGIAIAEFEAFAAALCRHENLHSAVTDLLRYEWLPVEGRDFTVKYDRSTANGVSIECEVFYPA
jgi:hypothetical protein